MQTFYSYIEKKDWLLYSTLNSALKNPGIFRLMRLITHLGDTLTSFIYILIAFKITQITQLPIDTLVVFSTLFTQIPVQLIKRIINRPRPYITHENPLVINPPKCVYSFPSGHTACAFSFAWILFFCFPVVGILALFIASIVGLSRIILGYHYPTDVFFGCLFAYLGALLSFGLFR